MSVPASGKTQRISNTCSKSVMLLFIGWALVALIFDFALKYLYRPPSVVCQSNLQETGKAIRMYAQDNDERFPSAARWIDLTLPYCKNINRYRCPIVKESDTDGYGYAFNNELSTVSTSAIPTPFQIFVVYDSAHVNRNARASGLKGLAKPPRHEGKNNVSFADGHVSAMNPGSF